jgi:hypothetical protein
MFTVCGSETGSVGSERKNTVTWYLQGLGFKV